VVARRFDQVDDVAAQLGCDVHLAELARPRRDDVAVGDGLEIFRCDRAGVLRVEDRELGVAVGVADAQPEEEAVDASDRTPEGWEIVPDHDQTGGYWH